MTRRLSGYGGTPANVDRVNIAERTAAGVSPAPGRAAIEVVNQRLTTRTSGNPARAYAWSGEAQPIARWSYADAAARDAATYTSADIGYVARVESPLGFFRLAGVNPLVWELIGGGGSAGPQPITLPAGAWIMRRTDGAIVDSFEEDTNLQNLYEVVFSHLATAYAQATIIWPDGATTCTARVYWRATEGTGDVCWRLRARCYAHDEAIDQAWGTAQSVTDTLTATGRVLISPATAAITPAGTVSGGSLCQLELDRDHTVLGNLPAPAGMLAVRLEFA
jgi:hypothetical protein